MAGALGIKETAWLDEHLADCPACSSVAAQYAADRLALRALRDAAPEPPRDLWARTAAAIEQESGGRRRATSPSPRRGSRIPLGALSGIAVIAVVIGVSTLSANLFVPAASGRARERRTSDRRPVATSAAPGRRAGDAVRRRCRRRRVGRQDRRTASPTTTPPSTRSAPPKERRTAPRFGRPTSSGCPSTPSRRPSSGPPATDRP